MPYIKTINDVVYIRNTGGFLLNKCGYIPIKIHEIKNMKDFNLRFFEKLLSKFSLLKILLPFIVFIFVNS